MLIRDAPPLKPRSNSSSSSSSAAISGSNYLGPALGVSLGILIPLIIVVAVVWWWKDRNIREGRQVSDGSKHPFTKESKVTERSTSNHKATSSPSQVSSGPSRKPQDYNEFSNPTTNGHSTSLSVDQASFTGHPSADRVARLASRDVHRTLGGMVEMPNNQRKGPDHVPTNGSGKMTSEDILEVEEVHRKSFLPDANDFMPDLEKSDRSSRTPSVGVVDPLDESISTPTISISEKSAQNDAARPKKPKPSIVARGISATPAVYAPVTRSRSIVTRRSQNTIVPKDSVLGGPSPPPARSEPSPLRRAHTWADMRAKPDSE